VTGDHTRDWLADEDRRREQQAERGEPVAPPPPPPPPQVAALRDRARKGSAPPPPAPAPPPRADGAPPPRAPTPPPRAAETPERPGSEPPRQRRPLPGWASPDEAAPPRRHRPVQHAVKRQARHVRNRVRRDGVALSTASAMTIAGLGLLAIFVLWFLVSLFQPFRGDGEGRVLVTIPKGAGVGDIADRLDSQGVVSSAFFFEARATLAGARGDLKPGTYVLRRDMDNGAAIDALSEGPPNDVVTVTIPEGRSRREVKRSLGNGLSGDYLVASRASDALDPRRYRAPRGLRSLEGFLFPATYQVKRGRSVQTLVDQQLQAFRRNFATVDMAFARRRNLTPYDVIIIASMVEREATLARERPIIASVIYNRLRNGIALGIDATIRFATDNWETPLTSSELATRSPYNTRLNPGLPPGPIGSPGLSSLRAAARPARTPYLYYVVEPGGDGRHAFSRTYEQFQRDVERYNRERERRGGQSPASG
jgi:UPF0755 protein